MTFSSHTPPETLCLLRLSALGDITHTLPVLRTLQHHWPNTCITWVIGKTEYEIVKDIGGVDFITFDKSRTLTSLLKLRSQMAHRKFDLLFHMQPSLRGNLVCACISSTIKLGFDHSRSHDLHGAFVNQRIEPVSNRQHVLDGLLEFPAAFGLSPVYSWNLPVAESARRSLQPFFSTTRNYVVINPCAVAKKRHWRNWTTEGYIAIIKHMIEKHGKAVVLCGGNSPVEHSYSQAIVNECNPVTNLIGKTSLAELVAILEQASLVIAPDTGPAHIASAVGTPTIGLYAATNPQRAAPYNHQELVVSEYPQALGKWHGKIVAQASWGTRIRNDEAMSLITAEQVIERIDQILLHDQT